MTNLESSKPSGLFIEIGQNSLQAAQGDEVFAFPLERSENGRLTDLCRAQLTVMADLSHERMTLSLRGFLNRKGRGANHSAICAIGARGVSLRRMSLPASSEEEMQQVLRLQIESEFPLSPDELAWGSRPIGPPKTPAGGGPARQELLVVALKKEVLEEYAAVLNACDIVPVFTLAALARAELHPLPGGASAMLDIGRTHSELMTFDNGVPVSIRILPWGGETITRSIEAKLSVNHDEAEKLKLTLDQPAVAFGPQGPALQSATETALAALVNLLQPATLGAKLYLTGKTARDPRLAPMLAGLLGGKVACESLLLPPGAGPTAAIAGMMKATGKHSASPLLRLQWGAGQGVAKPTRPAFFKWAMAAAFLALATLLFPYAQAIVMKPILEKKLAALKADRGRLAIIDQELDFLKFLKQNQPPYLDAIYLMARSSPRGTRLDSLAMGRHQEINLRLKLGNTAQVTGFRSKLIESGWFTNVMVEEQTPSPDRRMSVRMTAALRPAESRKPITAEPPGSKSSDEADFGPQPEPMMMMPSPEPMMAPPVRMAPAAPPPQVPQDNPMPTPPRRRVRPPIIMPEQ